MMAAAAHEHAHDPTQNHRGRLHDPTADESARTFALFGHLTVLGHLIVPVLAIIAQIVMYKTRKKDSPFLADHLREAVNFHVTILVYAVLLPIVVTIFGVLTLGIGLLLLLPVAFLPYALGAVGMVLAALAAQRGEYFRYPMTIRLLH